MDPKHSVIKGLPCNGIFVTAIGKERLLDKDLRL